MRYGIFADVHGNLEAFEAVLEALKNEAVERYVFAGDIVGYGANPIECIKMLRQLNPIMVAGNHDWAAAGALDKKWFNPYTEKAVEWTESVLSDEDKEFLKSMKLTEEAENAVVVHGSLNTPNMFK